MFTFFFLSSVLFNTRRYPTIGSYIKSKTKVLLIPYLLLSLLLFFFNPRLYDLLLIERYSYLNPMYAFSEIHSSLDFLVAEFISIFYHGTPITAGPLWFVFTLFLVNTIFFIVHHTLKATPKGIVIYALFCLTIGWYCNVNYLHFPYNLATVFTASFFFTLGYLTKGMTKYLSGTSKVQLGLIIIVLSLYYQYKWYNKSYF